MAEGLSRGDLVTVVMAREYGKPRPALVVQSDLYAELGSVAVCPITTELRDYSHFRVPAAPTAANGLQEPSQVMVDKVSAVARERVGQRFGKAEAELMAAVSVALSTFLGLG